jgi:hypothetical protein
MPGRGHAGVGALLRQIRLTGTLFPSVALPESAPQSRVQPMNVGSERSTSTWMRALMSGQGAIARMGCARSPLTRPTCSCAPPPVRTLTALGIGTRFGRCWDWPGLGSQVGPDGSALNGPAFLRREEYKG